MKIFPWYYYLRIELLENLGIIMYPKCLLLINFLLLSARLFSHPNNMNISSWSTLLKLLMTMKQSDHKTQVTPSSHVQLTMVDIWRLYHTKILSITLQTRRMKIFCVNSNAPLHRRDHLALFVLTKKDLVVMLWLNMKQERLSHSLYL